MQAALFKKLCASKHIAFKPKKMALLFSLEVRVRERDPESRLDVDYPFTRTGFNGQILEQFQQPALFEVCFFYERAKRQPA